MTTDPFTGSTISPGDSVVRCPRGHLSLAASWQAAGNRCHYPGCNYQGPLPSMSQLETSSSANLASPTPPNATMSAPRLEIRVLTRQRLQRPWQPILWSSLASALVTMIIFGAVAAAGWAILLSRSGVPNELLRNYIPINGTFLVLAAISVLIAMLVISIARYFWPSR